MSISLQQHDTHPREFWTLLKPRVMSLSIFTAWCAMIFAPGHLHPFLFFGAIVCIAMGAGAAGCLNMWCEVHQDSLMQRTKNRPLPAKRITPNAALAFGLLLATLSVALLGLITNWLASSLLALTIFSYVCVYTLFLKPRTPHNIVIGGASGALPPVIGWTCVTGHTHETAWVLFLIIFFWTPAHFWALCLEQKNDYAKAGFPMYPCVFGDDKTRRSIVLYTALTVLSSGLLCYVWQLTMFYKGCAVLLGTIFSTEALMVYIKKTGERKLFFISIFYLFFLFLSFAVDRFFIL